MYTNLQTSCLVASTYMQLIANLTHSQWSSLFTVFMVTKVIEIKAHYNTQYTPSILVKAMTGKNRKEVKTQEQGSNHMKPQVLYYIGSHFTTIMGLIDMRHVLNAHENFIQLKIFCYPRCLCLSLKLIVLYTTLICDAAEYSKHERQ